MRLTAAHFKVAGVHIDGAREASVTIDPRADGSTFLTVKPHGKRSEYRLPLAVVAEMVAWRVAKLDAERGGR